MADSEEQTKYDMLLPIVMPEIELKYYNYPCMDPEYPGRILPAPGEKLLPLIPSLAECIKCLKSYQVDAEGMPVKMDWCFYHDEEYSETTDKFSCCGGDTEADCCKSNTWHVNEGLLLEVNHEGFKQTQFKEDREPNDHGVYGLSTKCCYTPNGLELTRVIVVDRDLEIIYDKLVKPIKPILDYDTGLSGLKKGDLDQVTTRLTNVQRDLLEMFSSKSILVGHRLDIALKYLKLVHKHVVDASVLYLIPGGPDIRKSLLECLQLEEPEEGEVDARLALRVAFNKADIDKTPASPSGALEEDY